MQPACVRTSNNHDSHFFYVELKTFVFDSIRQMFTGLFILLEYQISDFNIVTFIMIFRKSLNVSYTIAHT